MQRTVRTSRASYVLALLMIVSGLSACEGTSNRAIAEQAVDKFHSQLNSEMYEVICSQAAPEFKANQSLMINYLKTVRESLGKVKEATAATGSVQNMNDFAQITLAYITTFEQGKAAEEFVFMVKDGKASLVMYECLDVDKEF